MMDLGRMQMELYVDSHAGEFIDDFDPDEVLEGLNRNHTPEVDQQISEQVQTSFDIHFLKTSAEELQHRVKNTHGQDSAARDFDKIFNIITILENDLHNAFQIDGYVGNAEDVPAAREQQFMESLGALYFEVRAYQTENRSESKSKSSKKSTPQDHITYALPEIFRLMEDYCRGVARRPESKTYAEWKAWKIDLLKFAPMDAFRMVMLLGFHPEKDTIEEADNCDFSRFRCRKSREKQIPICRCAREDTGINKRCTQLSSWWSEQRDESLGKNATAAAGELEKVDMKSVKILRKALEIVGTRCEGDPGSKAFEKLLFVFEKLPLNFKNRVEVCAAFRSHLAPPPSPPPPPPPPLSDTVPVLS